MHRLTILVLALLAAPAFAADDRSHWMLEVKGGRFQPALDNWSDFYDSDHMPQFAAALSYKPLRAIEVGLEGAYMRDRGVGRYPISGEVGGEADYKLWPLYATLTLRADFTANQMFVPYVGGGLTRAYYSQSVDGRNKNTGTVDGHQLRAGLQIRMDAFDRADAANLRRSGVEHSALVIEAQEIVLKENTTDVDLGGRSYLIGLAFEF
jgi:opacity protein-like surface antigen